MKPSYIQGKDTQVQQGLMCDAAENDFSHTSGEHVASSSVQKRLCSSILGKRNRGTELQDPKTGQRGDVTVLREGSLWRTLVEQTPKLRLFSFTGVLTLLLLPVRVLAIAVLLVVAWLLACIGLIGLSEHELRERPLVGWRRRVRDWACCTMCALFRCAGFHSVSIRGRRATRAEAPVIALAPHSSFFDALPVVFAGAPSIVAKADTSYLYFIGSTGLVRILSWLGRSTYQAGGMRIVIKGRQVTRKEAPVLVIAPHSTFMDAVIVYLINYTQPVYVWRDDPNSRQNTIREIVQRATSDQDWPQVLIFPEGTCTNRSCLITFKPGAFYPGVPIQPLNSSCEIEFLPVYHPSPEEQADPKLYANNVRDLMAKALGIPVSDYTYADCLLINRALELNIPSASDLIKVQKLRTKMGLTGATLEHEVEAASRLSDTWIGLSHFCEVLKDGSGSIDIRSYLLDCLVIYKTPKTEEMVRLAFKVVSGITGEVSRQGAVRVMRLSLGLTQDQAEKVYDRVDKSAQGHITYAELVNYARRRKRFEGIFPCQIKDDISTSEEQISDESSEHPHRE
ncbi:hypothetical protein B566_EDAN012939 [Ephemera danica]|nr:hypothetical protein B566_EDAN012939 [Ephemera danica]